MRHLAPPVLLSLLLLVLGCGQLAETDTLPTAPVDTVATSTPAEPSTVATSDEPSSPPAPEPLPDPEGTGRRWRDPLGNVLGVGDFISLTDERVAIYDDSTSTSSLIPLESLRPEDQQFAREQADDDLLDSTEIAATEAVETEATEDTRTTPEEMSPAERRHGQKVVVPFDFTSEFDEGDYGRRLGEMVRMKIFKEGGFLVPDSMHEIRDFCQTEGIEVTNDTSIEAIGRIVREEFQADIGIWGKVERVPPNDWDIYDLVIHCVDFSGSEPKTIYEVSSRTQTVSEIPHLYVKEMLDKLYDRPTDGPPPVNAFAEKNWEEKPNLVTGDFETGTAGVPTGWESWGGHNRDPLGGVVAWTTEHGNPSNKVIRFQFNAGVGDSTGCCYYSDWFPVEEGATYRFQCRYRANGPKLIVFIKCYDAMGSEYTTPGQASTTPGGTGYVPEESQRRECYRSQQNLKGAKNTWNTQTEDFTPRHTKYTPRWGRVELYAYLGAGVIEWDDVIVKQILPASASDSNKDPRHSMESGVTIEQMQENERRANEEEEKEEEE